MSNQLHDAVLRISLIRFHVPNGIATFSKFMIDSTGMWILNRYENKMVIENNIVYFILFLDIYILNFLL